MIRGLYTSGAGMVAQQTRLDVAANNLANASTAGYRADAAVTAALPSMFIHRFHDAVAKMSFSSSRPQPVGYLGTGTAVAEVTFLNRGGQYRHTGRELDFALQGEGYFVVDTPAGERYTRDGAFQVNGWGELTTSEGFPVLSRGGGIVRADDPDIAASLRVAGAPAGQQMNKIGHNLFVSPEPLALIETTVLQGVLEEANVSPVEAMVDLITAMRTYEAGQKAIQTQDQTLDKLINEVGRV
ncbi:MAG: flagellar hook-basal body protein [Firmicutes bacterium]|nr:flagellar hook-basal body protein [Bacillota bacterium]